MKIHTTKLSDETYMVTVEAHNAVYGSSKLISFHFITEEETQNFVKTLSKTFFICVG